MAMDKNEARRKKDRFATAGLLVLFTILAVLIILPIYAIFLASFKPGGHLLQYGLNLDLDFSVMNLDNYVLLFTGSHDYWTWFYEQYHPDRDHSGAHAAHQLRSWHTDLRPMNLKEDRYSL